MITNVNTSAAKKETLCARAPGKVILSGEHSVVYGADALAVAVKQYTYVNFSPVSQSKTINTLFSGISTGVSYPLSALSKLKHRLDARFDDFSKGNLPVQHILSHPNDLVMYALSALMHQLPSRKQLSPFLPKSGVLRSESTIPAGAGMGSSAAAIAATLILYEEILDKPLTHEQRFDMVRRCERLQHGKGSAIDAATVTFGGINKLSNHVHSHSDVALGDHWYWIHTGTPAASTGECVQRVKKHHAKDALLWDEFNTVTQALEKALSEHSDPSHLIKQNHQLLNRIGVVPQSASDLIKHIESLGGYAKISGAGSITGENAGLVLAYFPACTQEPSLLERLKAQSNGYIQNIGALEMDEHGAVRTEAPADH